MVLRLRTRLSRTAALTALFAVLAATALALLGRLDTDDRFWPVGLFSNFPVQLAIGSGLVGFLCAVSGRWRGVGVAACTLVLNLATIASFKNFETPDPRAGPPHLRIASANIHRNPAALARLAQEASDRGVDIIFAYEAAPLNEGELRRLFPAALTIRRFDASEAGESLPYPLLMVAHIPVDGIRLERMGERAILEVDAHSGGTGTRLVAAHPVSPGSPRDAHARNMLLRSLRQRAPTEGPYVMVGDFNATPWSPIFADLPGTRAGNPAWVSPSIMCSSGEASV